MLLAACSGAPAGPTALPLPEGAQQAVVVRHVDGDTLLLRGEGAGPLPAEPTRVRLLQVDTPEVGPDAECFGAEASARLAELVPVGAGVRVVADVDRLDRFGRTLLLVWDADGRSVQEALVRGGLAEVLQVGRNDAGLRPLEDAEAEARAARRGRWGAC